MRPARTTTGSLPARPRIIFPEWPQTVDAAPPGISLYGTVVSTSSASTTLPSPEPRTTPTDGCNLLLERTKATASSIAWIMTGGSLSCTRPSGHKENCVERFSALIGFVVILGIAFGLSNNKRAIRWRTVGWGLSLQIVIAIAVLKGAWIAQKLAPIALPLERYG